MKRKAILFSVVSLTTFLFGCGRNDHVAHAESGHSHASEQQKGPQGEHDHHQQNANPANTNVAAVNTNEHDRAPEGGHTAHGVEFKEGRGLSIPAMTRETIGLRIVDVTEGKSTRRIDLPLRIFQSEKSTNNQTVFLASGPVDTNLVTFLQPGTEVTLASDGSTLGKVVRIEPDSARLTGLAEVVVRLPASQNTPVGSFFDGKVTVTTKDDVVLIPRQALLKTAEGHFAYVVNGHHFFRTRITVGGQEGDAVEVTDGLYGGDRVALQPLMTLWLAELQAIRGGKACADGH